MAPSTGSVARDTEGGEDQISARRGDASFAVLNAHVFRFAREQVAEFCETSGDQHAVDAVFG